MTSRRKPHRPTQSLRSHPSKDDIRRGPPQPPEGGIKQHLPELPSDPRQRAQLLREFEARAEAYLDTKLAWGRAQQRDGDPLRMKAARRLARNWSRPLAEYIEAEAQKAKGKRGPKDRWQSAYNALGADALAYHTVSAILNVMITRLSSDGRNKPVHATAVSRAIGRQIATATRLAAWAKGNRALFNAYQHRLDKVGATPRHREEVLAIGLNKKARNSESASPEFLEATEPWPEVEQARIGKWLLIVSTKVTKGAITLRRHTEGKKAIKTAPYHVELSPKAVEWLRHAVEASALRATNNRAMICEPRPWQGPRDGGYLLGDDLRFDTTSMIRGIPPVRKAIEEALASGDATQAALPVFTALNVLQETPFAINEAVHNIAKQAAEADLKLDDLPASYRLERVPKAPPTGDRDADKARHAEWKRKQAKVANTNARNVSKALWSQSVLAEAAELRELEIDGAVSNGPLYFAHRVDFRGRMYPAGSALNPHGSDLARSLLRFHRGKPIGDGRGPFWLAAQVAKAFGRDKLSWDERVAWT
jgi:DNA-directed RNA polymerase, mitochondrial